MAKPACKQTERGGDASRPHLATKKLNALARFMNNRKELTVSVEGSVDRQKDGTRTSGKEPEEKTFDEKLRAQKVQKKDSSMENVIDDNQLKQLAQMRAEQVQTYLTQQGKVAANRVQLKSVKINDSSTMDNWGVEFFLSIE